MTLVNGSKHVFAKENEQAGDVRKHQESIYSCITTDPGLELVDFTRAAAGDKGVDFTTARHMIGGGIRPTSPGGS